jgi:hypothetical protein
MIQKLESLTAKANGKKLKRKRSEKQRNRKN